MELKYSKTGTPYIELDEHNKIIFSSTTKSNKGYKWLVFSGIATTTETLSAGRGKTKTKKKVEVTAPISTIMNMSFGGLNKSMKNLNKYMNKRYMDGMNRMFEPYLDEDGFFPESNLKKLSDFINTIDVVDKNDLLDEDPMGYYEEDDSEDDE